MKIHKGSLRLAAVYLLIMMAISMFFSFTVYQLSSQELDRGLRGPGGMGPRLLESRLPEQMRSELRQVQTEHYLEAKERVARRLIFINLVILIAGGLLSYYLALRTLKPIEESYEALNRFTADASHELRTPITAMRTGNEVALMDPKLTLKQAKDQLLSNIEELDRLTGLTDGLLQLARLSGAEADHDIVELGAITDEAISRCLPLAEPKKILLKSTVPPGIFVRDSRMGLINTLVILLDNAVKYSPESSEVIVDAKLQHSTVLWTVSDQGIGIHAKDQPHIFERFYRSDSARSNSNGGGYGLGLAIAKEIIGSLGGTIEVSSKHGKGSVFTLSLPARN